MENSTDKQATQHLEISYEMCGIGRIFSAHLFDFFVSIVLGLILLIGTFAIVPNIPFYHDAVNERNDLLISSSLYIKKEDGNLITIVDRCEDDDESTYNEKSELIDRHLSYFFLTFLNEELKGEGASIYLGYKVEAKNEDSLMFNEKGERLLSNSTYDKSYYEFYKDTFENGAIPRLPYKKSYVSTRQTILVTMSVSIVLTFFLSFIIFYVVIPQCIARGKRTLGMLICRSAHVDAKGFSPAWWRYLLKSLFEVVFIIFASVPCFLVPLAISITMLVMRKKDHQTLSDYIFGTYCVSLANQNKVYLNLYEYLETERKVNNFNMIEDKSVEFK